jgi:hypothetical protein
VVNLNDLLSRQKAVVSGDGGLQQEVTHMVHDAADVPAGPASLDSVRVQFDDPVYAIVNGRILYEGASRPLDRRAAGQADAHPNVREPDTNQFQQRRSA